MNTQNEQPDQSTTNDEPPPPAELPSVAPIADPPQLLDARAHYGDGDSAAREAGALPNPPTPEVQAIVDETIDGLKSDPVAAEAIGDAMPVAEALVHAMAATAHQHNAVESPVDESPRPAKLPFPRPPFDVNKHLTRIFAKRAEIRELALEATRKEKAKKDAATAAANANNALAVAQGDLAKLVDALEEDAQAPREPVQQALREPGRAACSYERAHPGVVCPICSTGGTHNGDGHVDAGGDRMQLDTPRRNSESLRDALAAVGFETITVAQIDAWTGDEYREATEWAAAEHAKARDSSIVVPPLPECIATASDDLEPDDDDLDDEQDEDDDIDDDDDDDDEDEHEGSER